MLYKALIDHVIGIPVYGLIYPYSGIVMNCLILSYV